MKNNEQKTPVIFFSSKIILTIYVLILLVTFLKTYHTVFDKKINLGGDNAGYYILGNAIASGFGYTNMHTKEGKYHNHFPPGYPLIIACASKLFSSDVHFIKKVNGFFLLMLLVVLFLLVYEFTGNYHIPFITCLFSLFNYHLLSFSVIMMSEIPFLFFSTLCFWVFLKVDFALPLQKNARFFILVICLSFAYHIRSTCLALFVAMVVSLFIKRKWKYSSAMILMFVLAAFPWHLRSMKLGGNSYIKQLFEKNPYRPELGQMQFTDWFYRVWNNFERYLTREIPSGIFNFIEVPNYNDPVMAVGWIPAIGIVALMLFGMVTLKKISDILIPYIVAFFGIVLLWPEVWFGVRFLIPLIPILLFLFIQGVVQLLIFFNRKVLKINSQPVVHLVMVVLSLLTIKGYAKPALDKLEKQKKGTYSNGFKNYFELAVWSKTHTPKGSVISCRKGHLFYLYADRYVTGFKNTLNSEEQIEYLRSKHTDYVVLDQLGYTTTSRYLYPAIEKYPEKFRSVKHLKNPDTYLLKFLPESGYWGEWKGNKKHGKGVYLWDNQQKFEGEWKDDLRNGKGTLIFPNSQRLEGFWTNDTLNGEAILKSENGVILEKSVYSNDIKIYTIDED